MNSSPVQTYKLVTGRTPFEAFDMDERYLVAQFKTVIGGVPENWIHDALSNGVLKKSGDGKVTPMELKFG